MSGWCYNLPTGDVPLLQHTCHSCLGDAITYQLVMYHSCSTLAIHVWVMFVLNQTLHHLPGLGLIFLKNILATFTIRIINRVCLIMQHIRQRSFKTFTKLKWMNLTHFGSCFEMIYDVSAPQLDVLVMWCFRSWEMPRKLELVVTRAAQWTTRKMKEHKEKSPIN